MGEAGLKILRETGDRHGLPVVTEVMDTRDVEMVGNYTDIYQIGTRNMTNYSLLREIGTTRKPVMLKRGWASTIAFSIGRWSGSSSIFAARNTAVSRGDEYAPPSQFPREFRHVGSREPRGDNL